MEENRTPQAYAVKQNSPVNCFVGGRRGIRAPHVRCGRMDKMVRSNIILLISTNNFRTLMCVGVLFFILIKLFWYVIINIYVF